VRTIVAKKLHPFNTLPIRSDRLFELLKQFGGTSAGPGFEGLHTACGIGRSRAQ
jgi:hypothetical protein